MTFMDPLGRISRLTLLCLFIVSAWTTVTAQQRILWQGRVRPDQINVYTSASLTGHYTHSKRDFSGSNWMIFQVSAAISA
jgi:hypothetical protein